MEDGPIENVLSNFSSTFVFSSMIETEYFTDCVDQLHIVIGIINAFWGKCLYFPDNFLFFYFIETVILFYIYIYMYILC